METITEKIRDTIFAYQGIILLTIATAILYYYITKGLK